MSDAFDKWFHTTMLPAECDDERVIVGMRLCWNAALLYAADIAKRQYIKNKYPAKTKYSYHNCIGRGCHACRADEAVTIYNLLEEEATRKEVHGE